MRYFRRKLLYELERKREKIIIYKFMLMTRKINCAICGGSYLNHPSKKEYTSRPISIYDFFMKKKKRKFIQRRK